MRAGRAVEVQDTWKKHTYLVLDSELSDRVEFYCVQEWASTDFGRWHLREQVPDGRGGTYWSPIPVHGSGPSGYRWTVKHKALMIWKNHCDKVYGDGNTWFRILAVFGGVPVECIDAWNFANWQRQQAARALLEAAGAPTPGPAEAQRRDLPDPRAERPRTLKYQAIQCRRAACQKAKEASRLASSDPALPDLKREVQDLRSRAWAKDEQAFKIQNDAFRRPRTPPLSGRGALAAKKTSRSLGSSVPASCLSLSWAAQRTLPPS